MAARVTDEELTEAILMAGRAMVAVALRSLAERDMEITLAQYRTVVALAEGPKRLADLAETLGVSPSTATRMCDRLTKKGLVDRARDSIDRREVQLSVTDEGRQLVQRVMKRRRSEVRAMLRSIPEISRPQLVASLEVLVRAAGEAPDVHWSPGWHAEEPAFGELRTSSAS